MVRSGGAALVYQAWRLELSRALESLLTRDFWVVYFHGAGDFCR